MNKNIKLTYEGFEKLKKAIGVDFGIFNLDTGVIKIGSYGYEDVILQLDKLYGIDNIDMVPYNPAPAQRDAQEELAERIQMIGRDVRVGSVVKINVDKKTRHAVVIAIRGKIYDCALMKLKVAKPNEAPEHAIRVRKGQDILYRNLTYREVVEVTDEVIPNVKFHDLLHGGGRVVGRIINEYTLMRIIKMCKARMNMPKSSNVGAGTTEVEEQKVESHSGLTQQDAEPADAPASHEPESLPTVETMEVRQQENMLEATDVKDEDESSRPEDLNFEDRVSRAQDLDTLFECLEIDSLFLKLAIRICVENQRVNMKNLYGSMQGRQEELCLSKKLSQNAIKNIVGQDFAIWLGDKRVSIEKADIAYFLKAIIKNVKK